MRYEQREEETAGHSVIIIPGTRSIRPNLTIRSRNKDKYGHRICGLIFITVIVEIQLLVDTWKIYLPQIFKSKASSWNFVVFKSVL